MALDLVSAGIGLGVGVLATVFVRELVFRTVQNTEHTKLTAHWSLTEDHGSRPVKLCAEQLSSIEVPPGSQVLVGRGTPVAPEVRQRCEVRVTDRIQSNFALGEDRALVFASGVKPGALAVWTFEDQVLQRLALEWEQAWRQSEPLVPRASITELRGLLGQTVEVVGSVSDLAERGGMHYVRLIDNGFTATVASPTPLDAAKGSTVRVLGTVDRAVMGKEPVLRAQKLERVTGPVAPRAR
jgi:hypothetical protein